MALHHSGEGGVSRRSIFSRWDIGPNSVRSIQGGALQLPSGYVKIAIENGPFIVDLPMKNGDFPWLC